MKDTIATKDAKKGGYLVGKPHSEGGIKGINVDTNQPIEVEGGEVVITKPAVESQKTYEFEGKQMKPREILSKLNSDHGGVSFKKGGEVSKSKYDTGGMVSYDILQELYDYYIDKPCGSRSAVGNVIGVETQELHERKLLLLLIEGGIKKKSYEGLNQLWFVGTFLYLFHYSIKSRYYNIPWQIKKIENIDSNQHLTLARIENESYVEMTINIDEFEGTYSVLPNPLVELPSDFETNNQIIYTGSRSPNNNIQLTYDPYGKNLGIFFNANSDGGIYSEISFRNEISIYNYRLDNTLHYSKDGVNLYANIDGVESGFITRGDEIEVTFEGVTAMFKMDSIRYDAETGKYDSDSEEQIYDYGDLFYGKEVIRIEEINTTNVDYEDNPRNWLFVENIIFSYETQLFKVVPDKIKIHRIVQHQRTKDGGKTIISGGGVVGKTNPTSEIETKSVAPVEQDLTAQMNSYYVEDGKGYITNKCVDLKPKLEFDIDDLSIAGTFVISNLSGGVMGFGTFPTLIFRRSFIYILPIAYKEKEIFGKYYDDIDAENQGMRTYLPFQVLGWSTKSTERYVESIQVGRIIGDKFNYLNIKIDDLVNRCKYYILPNILTPINDSDTIIYTASKDGNNSLKLSYDPYRRNIGFYWKKNSGNFIKSGADFDLFLYEQDGKVTYATQNKKYTLVFEKSQEEAFIGVGDKVRVRFYLGSSFNEISDFKERIQYPNTFRTIDVGEPFTNTNPQDRFYNPTIITIKALNSKPLGDGLKYEDLIFETEDGKMYTTDYYVTDDDRTTFEILDLIEPYQIKNHKPVVIKEGGVIEEMEVEVLTTEPTAPSTSEPVVVGKKIDFDAEINRVANLDVTDELKYELLLEAVESEETKLVVLRAISQSKPEKLREIDRRLEQIARLKGLYDLKRNSSLELLDKFEQSIQLSKSGDNTPVGTTSVSGEPSELTRYQQDVVNSEPFKNWFGDWVLAAETNDYSGVSKVVNPVTKEPLVLYHGTDADFTKWTFDKFPAAYFGDNYSYSKWFSEIKSQGASEGHIYEVFISMKNPINLQSFGLETIPMGEIFDFLEKNYQVDRFKIFPQLATIKNDPDKYSRALGVNLKIWQFVRKSTGFIKYLKEETFYDGILMFEDNPQDLVFGEPNTTGSFVVFFTSQIKWASAKFFNPAIEDNRFEYGGLLKKH
jgi:hypothetical protein